MGLPSSCYNKDGSVSKELVNKFLKAYLDHEGVDLHEELRTIAKATLSSLRGQFGQNKNNVLELTKNLRYRLTSFHLVSKECLRVATTLKDENPQPLKMGKCYCIFCHVLYIIEMI